MIDLSVIIVTYKGWARLRNCLNSLRFPGKDFSYEVIVVDNTPDPDEISEIRSEFPEFRFLSNSVNGGFANGSNLGAKAASGRFLLFLNPDAVASGKALSLMISTAQKNPGYGIISCSQFNENGKKLNVAGEFPSFRNITGFMRAVQPRRKFSSGGDSNNIIYPDWVSGSVMLIPSGIFRKLNGFSEDFWMYYEDVDICKRAADSGLKTVLLTGIEMEHNHGGSSRTDRYTKALTKTEVMISKHVYFARNSAGTRRLAIQSFLVLNNMLTCLVTGILGAIMLLEGIRMATRIMILGNITVYYLNALRSSTWLSRRSVNHPHSQIPERAIN